MAHRYIKVTKGGHFFKDFFKGLLGVKGHAGATNERVFMEKNLRFK